MSSWQGTAVRKHLRIEFVFLVLLAGLSWGIAGCSKPASSTPAEQPKRYHLAGKVVSVDQQQASVTVDGQEITADVVVAPDGAYLENIVVTKKASGSSSTAQPDGASHQPQPGDRVPDFALVNQDGKRIHLDAFRGKVLLVTFIYTRCPFPDFCPLVSKNFAHIYADLRKNPALESKIKLLSISFDSAYDTPPVLRTYGETFQDITGGTPFDRWEFATVPAKELPKVADFFGLYYSSEAGQIVHSLSTTVISPESTVYKWYQDNDWKPADLLADAAQALQQGNPAPHASGRIPAG